MKETTGILEAVPYNNQILWFIYTGDFTKREWNWEFMVPVEMGDYLKILNHSRKILWEGRINPKNQQIGSEHWNKFFYNQNLAILSKCG